MEWPGESLCVLGGFEGGALAEGCLRAKKGSEDVRHVPDSGRQLRTQLPLRLQQGDGPDHKRPGILTQLQPGSRDPWVRVAPSSVQKKIWPSSG